MGIGRLALLLMLLIGPLAACSCSDEMESSKNLTQSTQYKIISDNKYELLEFVYTMLIANAVDEEGQKQGEMLYAQVEKYANSIKTKNGLGNVDIAFRKIAYLYNSIDQYGKPIELSAMIFWLGYFQNEEWYDLAPEDIYLMEHYTISSNSEAPTVGFPLEPLVSGNKLIIMPDYIGYGSTKGMIHPYLNHELCAVNSIDALPSGYALFDALSEKSMSEGWRSVVMGASQGGGNALAIHKYMDTHASLAKQWNFAYSSCCAGPYSPAMTVDIYLESGKTIYPVVFPLTLKSMLDSYPSLFNGYSEEDFFSANYLNHKSKIDEMIGSKNYTSTEINNYFFENVRITSSEGLADNEILLKDILSEAMLDQNSQLVKQLYKALDKSDLTEGWRPKHPIKLYYSKGDKVVPYQNSIAVQEAFGYDMVTVTPFSDDMSHHEVCAAWMVAMK